VSLRPLIATYRWLLFFFGLAALVTLHAWHHRFTPERWREAWSCNGLTAHQCNTREWSCPRGHMVGHLLGSWLHAGRTTREDVWTLLGPPERVCVDGCMRYPVGVCDGSSGYHFLLVCFDGADDDSADADGAKLTRAKLRGGNLGSHSCVQADQ
jgi:hypothetical protein